MVYITGIVVPSECCVSKRFRNSGDGFLLEISVFSLNKPRLRTPNSLSNYGLSEISYDRLIDETFWVNVIKVEDDWTFFARNF